MKRLSLGRIPPEKRAEAWRLLQERCPDQAAWVQDPFVQSMREDFTVDGETSNFNAQLFVYLPEKEGALFNQLLELKQ